MRCQAQTTALRAGRESDSDESSQNQDDCRWGMTVTREWGLRVGRDICHRFHHQLAHAARGILAGLSNPASPFQRAFLLRYLLGRTSHEIPSTRNEELGTSLTCKARRTTPTLL